MPWITVGTDVRIGYDSSTGEAGVQKKMTNKTGAATVKGNLVQPSTGTANSFMLTTVSSINPTGVVYEGGVADASDAWVWCSGSTVQFLMKDSTAVVLGDWLGCSDVAGRAYAITGSPPSQAVHDRESGHTNEANAGGTDQLVLGELHFR